MVAASIMKICGNNFAQYRYLDYIFAALAERALRNQKKKIGETIIFAWSRRYKFIPTDICNVGEVTEDSKQQKLVAKVSTIVELSSRS